MTAEDLVAARRSDWTRLQQLLARRRLPPRELLELSMLYRGVAADAARARAAGADEGTLAHLERLLALAHNRIYRAPPSPRGAFLDLLRFGFPEAVRRNRRFVQAAAAAFFLPFAFGLAAAAGLPDFAAAVMGPAQVEMFKEMYRAAPEEARSLGHGSLATSFYIQHNTTIAFEVFANGIFAGLGSLFMLVYQGLVIGSVFGVLVADDKTQHLLTFTCGHSAWELVAIVVAGAAGLRMGWALVETRGLARLASLRAAAPDVFRLVAGAAFMLAVAAFIEGLWSPSQVPAPAKWIFALLQAGLVAVYLTRAGAAAPGVRKALPHGRSAAAEAEGAP